MSNFRPAPSIYTPEAMLATIQGVPFVPDYPEPKFEAPERRHNDHLKHLRLIAEALERSK